MEALESQMISGRLSWVVKPDEEYLGHDITNSLLHVI